MDPLAAVGLISLLIALLAFLGRWQHRIEHAQHEEILANLYEAQERGTDRAIAQYPHIDIQACIGCGSCIAACPEERVIGLVGGVARVIHGARCIGHALCADVCPVGAIEVGLGDTSKRSDIPLLDERLQTSRPGIWITGELGGMALIRIAIDQGVKAIGEIASELSEAAIPQNANGTGDTPEAPVDVLIVGAGPAGLAATLESKRLGLSYRTIDREDIGGTVRKYPRRKLTIVGEVSLPLHGRVTKKEFLKEELIEFWQSVIDDNQVDIRTRVHLVGIDGGPDLFIAKTTAGDTYARRVILALGRRGAPRKLEVPGEEHEKVQYQLIDAASYRNEKVLIVGGGDSAIEAATGLADQSGNTVTLSYRRADFFRLKSRNRERIEQYVTEKRIRVLFESTVERIEPDSVRIRVSREGTTKSVEIPNAYVFVFAGGEPPYTLLRGLGIRFGGEEPAPESLQETVGA